MVKHSSRSLANKCQQLKRGRAVAHSEAVLFSTKPWEEQETLCLSSGPGAEETWITAVPVSLRSFTLLSAKLRALVSQEVKACLYGFRHFVQKFSFPSQGRISRDAVPAPSGSSWHSFRPVLLPQLTESSSKDLKTRESPARSCLLCRSPLRAERALGIKC